jgi:hypothetical protein
MLEAAVIPCRDSFFLKQHYFDGMAVLFLFGESQTVLDLLKIMDMRRPEFPN